MLRTQRHQQPGRGRYAARTANRKVAPRPARARRAGSVVVRTGHSLCRCDENSRLFRYEHDVKRAFDEIVTVLKQISAIQNDSDFVQRAQRIARDSLGFSLPEPILEDAWVDRLNMRRLYAWCVFQTYLRFCDEFYKATPTGAAEEFQAFLQECGIHSMDITPCADGRLAHLVRYVLRLSPRAVRRKSYAGAMFDVEDSVQKWVETELRRYREAVPNPAHEPTRYLKVVAYHFSSGDPTEGCAAHGSDTKKAAQAGLERLLGFRQAIENSFCCGASIELLLIGVDTDTDAIRIHVPDADGDMSLERFVDAGELYDKTLHLSEIEARRTVESAIRNCAERVTDGMARLIAKLVANNFSQIEYVRTNHGEHYPDIGHAERFIGAGIGFEDIQIRNLMYFAYLNTVEEGTDDLDVGIKIFTGLNIKHGLPAPIVVRFDYHGIVPGDRERAKQRCARVAKALAARYAELYEKDLLHVLQVARDCDSKNSLDVFACTIDADEARGH